MQTNHTFTVCGETFEIDDWDPAQQQRITDALTSGRQPAIPDDIQALFDELGIVLDFDKSDITAGEAGHALVQCGARMLAQGSNRRLAS